MGICSGSIAGYMPGSNHHRRAQAFDGMPGEGESASKHRSRVRHVQAGSAAFRIAFRRPKKFWEVISVERKALAAYLISSAVLRPV
jgi:hypothetical protein